MVCKIRTLARSAIRRLRRLITSCYPILCVFSRMTWANVLGPINLGSLTPQNDECFWTRWLRSRKSDSRKGFDSLVMLVRWMLWKEHNQGTFGRERKQNSATVPSVDRRRGQALGSGCVQAPPAVVSLVAYKYSHVAYCLPLLFPFFGADGNPSITTYSYCFLNSASSNVKKKNVPAPAPARTPSPV